MQEEVTEEYIKKCDKNFRPIDFFEAMSWSSF